MMLSQTENCNLVFKSSEHLCLTFLTVFLTLTLVLDPIKMMTTCLSFEKCLILNLRHFKGNLAFRNGWSALGEGWPCCTVSSWALGKPKIYNNSLLWICIPVICVEFEAAKYVPTNCEWLIARTKMEISFVNYHWLFKWKISCNLNLKPA